MEIYCGEGNGNPLQYSCLENPVDRGAWWAAVHGVTQSWTQLKRLSMHACIGEGNGNPLQCSCLENPRDRGAWWAAICGAAQRQTRLKWLSSSSSRRCIGLPQLGKWGALYETNGLRQEGGWIFYNAQDSPQKQRIIKTKKSIMLKLGNWPRNKVQINIYLKWNSLTSLSTSFA